MTTPKTIDISLAALIAANIVPIFGVIFLGWDALSIVLLYWSESIVIGFYNVLKIAFAKMSNPPKERTKLSTIFFFIIHYSGFMTVHGFFIETLVKKKRGHEQIAH